MVDNNKPHRCVTNGRRFIPGLKVTFHWCSSVCPEYHPGGFIFFLETDGCPGRSTGGISRVSAGTCCAIPCPELSRLNRAEDICAVHPNSAPQTKRAAAAPPRLPPGRFQRSPLANEWTLRVSKVPGTSQRNRKGTSSGADLSFRRPSAREERRRLGRFRGRGRVMGAKSTQRTILVVSIHPPASPAIGRICRVLCMQVR